MPKRWVILTCMLFLGSTGRSEATPLDSPDIVHIDGLPCNSACQSYLARSREKTAPASSKDTDHLVAILMARPEIKKVSDLTSKIIAVDDRQSASSDNVRTAITAAGAAEVQLSKGQTKAIDRLISGEVPAAVLTLVYPEAAEWFPKIASFRIFRIPLSPRSSHARLEPAGNAAAKSVMTPAKIVESPPKIGDAANSSSRTIQQQVAAATALAEHVTAAAVIPAPQQKANNSKDRSDHSETVLRDAEKTASALPNNTDPLVVLLMARPEIKSVSDLTNQIIAVDDGHWASNDKVRTAIAAAGAIEVQLSEGQTKALDRLISGEAPAAVLTLVSAEAAEWFPEIAGFRIFRIPLSPRSLNARREPAGYAAAGSKTRTIQEQVTAATVIAEHVMTLRDAETTASASPNNTDPLVVLLMARPEIKSISDLTGKIIAIDDRHSASNGKIRTAIAAAGAADAQLSEGQTKAIDRLISGEVPAAVLTLVYPETGFPQFAGFKIFRVPLSPGSLQAGLETAGNAAAKSVTASAKIAEPPANSSARTIQQQVTAATVIAEHVMTLRDAETTASASPNNTDPLVVLLMARPEIKSISDLTGKIIAIDDRHSASNGKIRTAIAAAGAADAQLSEGQTKAIDRLISGEVPAAVLTLVYPETGFPQFAGFKIFRVPLSPGSLQAGLETAGNAAAKSVTAPAAEPASAADQITGLNREGSSTNAKVENVSASGETKPGKENSEPEVVKGKKVGKGNMQSSSSKPVMMILRTVEFPDGRREERLLPMNRSRRTSLRTEDQWFNPLTFR